jgi:hypothetical protein
MADQVALMAKRTGEKVRLETRDGRHVAVVYVPPFEPAAEMVCWGQRFFRLHQDPADPAQPRVYREGLLYHVIPGAQEE